jgi:hypothetical protein
MTDSTCYVGRRGSMSSDVVVYHRDVGPTCSVWMVPGTHTETPSAPYSSAILAADRTDVLAAAVASGEVLKSSTARLQIAYIGRKHNAALSRSQGTRYPGRGAQNALWK